MSIRNYPFAATALSKGPDPAWQKEMGSKSEGAIMLHNFEGTSNVNGKTPPDTQGDVGPNHYFQVINVSYQIWDKNGNSVLGPGNISDIWAAFSPSTLTDPIVLYDEHADRWFISIISLYRDPTSYKFKSYIAVSQTNDPTGSWYCWEYEWDYQPDFAKYGVWRDGYYFLANSDGNDVGVFDRNAMLNGQADAGY
jgi:hypothetical protein